MNLRPWERFLGKVYLKKALKYPGLKFPERSVLSLRAGRLTVCFQAFYLKSTSVIFCNECKEFNALPAVTRLLSDNLNQAPLP
jgi:hypothetical protein